MKWQDNLKNMINKQTDTLYSIFVNFLKKHSAYNRFINNLEEYDNFPSLKHLIMAENNEEWICSAFSWEDSPEGEYYWDKLDDKWREKCNKNIGLRVY